MNKIVLVMSLLLIGNVHAEELPQVTAAGIKKVPQVEVKMACEECSAKEKAGESANQIIEAYKSYMENHGAVILSNEKIVFSVSEFNARKTRLFGMLGGKDVISGNAEYNGKILKAEDYMMNAVFGIEDVAKNVGESLAKQVLD